MRSLKKCKHDISPTVNRMIRVAIIASGAEYQEAASWAAATYSRVLGPNRVSVLLPSPEHPLSLLQAQASEHAFNIQEFPFTANREARFACQLKCQGFLFALTRLCGEGDTLFLVDSDTCMVSAPLIQSDTSSAIMAGAIGMVQDIKNHHRKYSAFSWYLRKREFLPYVNSGVIVTSRKSMDMFETFVRLSEQPHFLDGPFNDQAVINFALGRYFRNRLVLLDKCFNRISWSLIEHTTIGHFAGGIGAFGNHPRGRKTSHAAACRKLLSHEPVPPLFP